MIRCYRICDGVPQATRQQAGAPCDGGLVWCHVNGQEAEALDWLKAQPGIPEIARNALLARETRPRADRIGNGEIVNLRGPGETPEDDPDDLVSVRFWAEAGRVISLGYNAPSAVETVTQDFMAGHILDPGDLLTAFAAAVTHPLDEDVAALGDELDEIELRLERDHARATRRCVNAVRGKAIRYRRFLVPQRDALERLSASSHDWLDDHDRQHLRDAADRFARMAEELEAIRERAAIVHDALTDMRAEIIDGRALMLSIVALIFLPLTFITGLLGMNVEGIPYAKEPWAFWGVVGFCTAIGLGVLGWFVARHWIAVRDADDSLD
jgi:zinc transporter